MHRLLWIIAVLCCAPAWATVPTIVNAGSGTVNTTNSAVSTCTSNCVSWVSGTVFNTAWPAGTRIRINNSGPPSTISSVISSTLIQLVNAIGTQTGVAYAVPQMCFASHGSGGISTQTCSVPENFTAGSTIEVITQTNKYAAGFITAVTATDNGGGASDSFSIPSGCIALTNTVATPTNAYQIAVAFNSAGGFKDVTVTYTGATATFSEMFVVEKTGSGGVDNCVNTETDSDAGTPISVNITTNFANESIDSSVIAANQAHTLGNGTGFIDQWEISDSPTGNTYLYQDQSAASTNTYAVSYTYGSGTNKVAIVALALKSPASGHPPGQYPRSQ